MATAPDIVYRPHEAAGNAEELLLAFWARDVERCPLPVDPEYIAARLGVDVLLADLERDTAGALFKERGHDPVIFVNLHDGTQRRRFTMAHELGHFYARTRASAGDHAAQDWAYIDKRDTFSRTGEIPAERYANAFAAALLMPAARVRRAWSEGLRTAPELASLFDVSLLSMEIRLDNLGLRG